jgi:hypothetical protein
MRYIVLTTYTTWSTALYSLEFAMPTAACIQLGLRILVFLGDSSTDICTTTLGSYKYCTVRTCWLSPAFSAGSCGLLKLIGTARLSIRSSIVEFLAARTARPGHHRIMHASRCSQKPKPKQTNTYELVPRTAVQYYACSTAGHRG